ncbi:protein N-terminal glutamine amidohydrolase isoform X2 [Cimex lectularius]|uniref:Protein N-terminal glutamine amidohydrolase n=1 Tax=Cimex lectularius TaxID=79782 RepID=A0A8I6SH18_CIMLE|nr:protein N-terminal glutamine amidohydrolase isoform X2 [Cimex lectularius]
MVENQTTDLAEDLPTKEECEYTSCYCEENIWKLCERLRDTGSNIFCDTYAVFVTNAARKTLVWCQMKGNAKDNLAIWDYHVFLVAKCSEKFVVFDFDTTLDIPCLFTEYFQKAVRLEDNFLPDFKRVFRVIPASVYLTSFASDRSHMKDKNGQFMSPPPLYPPIFCGGL